jgi:predicted SPOUT superfamily RNA methylase MTH1
MGLKFTRVLKSLNQTKQKKQEKKITIVTTHHNVVRLRKRGFGVRSLALLEQVLIGGGEKELVMREKEGKNKDEKRGCMNGGKRLLAG